MGSVLAVLGLVLVCGSIIPVDVITGGAAISAAWVLGAGILFIVLGAFLGARPVFVLLGILLAVPLFVVLPDGLPAILDANGLRSRAFFRSYENHVVLAGLVVMIAVYLLSLVRHPQGVFVGMADTADDVDDLVIAVGKIAAWLFVPMMIVISYDVTQRKILEFNPDFLDTVFAFSSTKLQELEWHLHAVLFLMCLGFGYARDAHVRIELVRDHLKPKARVWLEVFGALFFLLPYCYLVVKFGYTFADRAWSTNEVSAAQTGLSHRWIIKAFLPVGFAFLALAGIAGLLKNIAYLFGPDSLKPRVAEYAGTHHADLPDDVVEHGPITD